MPSLSIAFFCVENIPSIWKSECNKTKEDKTTQMDTTDKYFDVLCRACMNELFEADSYDDNTKPQQWLSIFDIIEEECGSLQIGELLTNAVPQIKVQLSDELPKRICSKCLQQLLSVNRFQQMCLQSEEQLRQLLAKKQIGLNIPGAAMEGEIGTHNADSYPCISSQPSSTQQNLEHTSKQKSFVKTTKRMVKPEAAETSDGDHWQNIDEPLEYSGDSAGNFSEIIKNEPIEDDERSIEYSDGETTISAVSVKGEELSIEFEEEQISETSMKKHNSRRGEGMTYECPYCPRRFKTSTSRNHHKSIHEGVKREVCDICGKSVRRSHLKTHKLIHSGVKAHKCDVCEMRFVTNSDLRSHMRKHTGEKPYKCKYCERCFSHSCDRTKHMRFHVGINVYRCELCPLAFPVASELRVHLTMHKNEDPETRERNMKALNEVEAKLQLKSSTNETHQPSKEELQQQREMNAKRNVKSHGEDMPHECPYCPRRFKTGSTMRRHKEVHEGVKREVCNICGKNIRKSHLKTHKLIHNGIKAYKCDVCEMRFVKNSDLRIHARTHTGERPHKCNYCERSFCQSSVLLNHMRRLHLGDNVYRCEFCPLAFPVASERRAHLTTHKNEDPETRERNMKALKEAEAKLQLKLSKNETQQPPKEESQQQIDIKPNKKTVKAHRIKQGKDKSHECTYCPRRFSTRSNMLEHKAIHEGVPRETCDICGKSISKKFLKEHKQSHSDEKVHKCDFCEMRFARKSYLNVHMRKHTGEKPFKCQYCQRSFSQSGVRIQHMRRHLGDNVYRCELCPLAFPAILELREHFTTHKNEDPETREQNMKALKEVEAKLLLKFSNKETPRRRKKSGS